MDKKKAETLKKKYNLPEDYIYYPAMYLPHKIIELLIDVIKQLKLKDIKITAVFTGSDVGYKDLISYAKNQEVLENINFLKFVNDNDLPYIYFYSKVDLISCFNWPDIYTRMGSF